MLMPSDALAQSRVFFDSSGRVSGRSTTGTNGSTTFYDASSHGPHLHQQQGHKDDLR
jgi:hypothetical protein